MILVLVLSVVVMPVLVVGRVIIIIEMVVALAVGDTVLGWYHAGTIAGCHRHWADGGASRC